jgi:hypothetical protein
VPSLESRYSGCKVTSVSFNMDWDEIQSEIRDKLEVKVNSAKRTIKLAMKGEMPEGFSIKQALGDGESLKPMVKMLTGEDIDFTAEALPDGKSVELRFKDDKSLKKMQQFIDGLVRGDLLKQLAEKMMKIMFEAFGGPGTTNS